MTSENNPGTILIIDDNAENRLLLSSQLKMEGYIILQAGGGLEGLEKAHANNPDIILLDVMMPDIYGFEVCKRLKGDETTRLIPVIMVTALRDTQYKIQGFEVGADEFLSRPHVREELLVRVRTLIQLKRARVRLEEERNRLRLLYQISGSIGQELNIDNMMIHIISAVQAATGATKGNIMLIDEQGTVVRKYMSRAGEEVVMSDKAAQEVMTEGLGGWLIKNNTVEIIDDITQDARWVQLPDDTSETGSAIGVPLARMGRPVGVLILNNPLPAYFTEVHRSLLSSIGVQITAAIENANLFADVNEERKKLRAILAQSSDAIITTNEALEISIVNQAAEKMFGLEASHAIGHSVQSLPQFAPLLPLFEQANNESHAMEIPLSNETTVFASISPIEKVGYTAVLQDITTIKQAELVRLGQERMEKQQLKDTLSRYMSPKIVDYVLSSAPGLLTSRERREAVVMFADLRNSTGGLITRVDPNDAIEQLNEFFDQLMRIAHQHDGTIFELTGDEILVGFNVPIQQDNAPILAIRTAVSMQREINRLRKKWYDILGTEVGLGIGIDLGNVVVGNVGAESRMSFRMVGEVMNNASRLVDLAEDGEIVISQTVYNLLQLTKTNSREVQLLLEHIHFAQHGPRQLKGINAPQYFYKTRVRRTPLQ